MPPKFGFDNSFARVWLPLHQTYNLVVKCEDEMFGKYGLIAAYRASRHQIHRQCGNSISLIVERMVKGSLVRRIRDLRDRRSVCLVITSNGKDILDRATVAGWELVQEILWTIRGRDAYPCQAA